METLIAPDAVKPAYSSNTFHAKILRDAKSKNGFIIPKGTDCTLACGEHRVKADTGLGTILFHYETAHKFFSCFDAPPSMDRLERESNDGICETPLGERTEPDGHDEYGCPSWLLVLGMI